MFDSTKFNGFVKTELDELLFDDIRRYYAFKEADLHAAAYFYIREYFIKRQSISSDDIFVRCEPRMENGTIPDIVLFRKYDPIYVMELKMLQKPEDTRIYAEVEKDLDKIAVLMKNYPTLKWGFLIVVYDSDDMFIVSDRWLRNKGYNNISVVPINLKRQTDNVRKRVGYDDWRKQFDRYLDKHF